MIPQSFLRRDLRSADRRSSPRLEQISGGYAPTLQVTLVKSLSIALSAGASIAAAISFQTVIQSSPDAAMHWEPALYALLCISALLTFVDLLVMQRGQRSSAYILLMRLVVVTLIGYPLGSNLEIEVILGSSLMIEAAVVLSLHGCVAFMLLCLSVLLGFQRAVIAWGSSMPRPSFPDLVAIGFQLFLVACISSLMAMFRRKYIAEAKMISRYDSAITQIVDANIGFQEYANTIDEQSASGERKRISREIHDTIGYSLTNIIMLSQQALYAEAAGSPEIRSLLLTLNAQAREGFNDIRRALYELRAVEAERLPGLNMIRKITRIFTTATGVIVDLQMGNAPWDFGLGINAFLYRLIQEGLTNSYRHGGATLVRVHMWVDAEKLSLVIHDNGRGTTEVIPGIGLSGMKERVEQFGGMLLAQSVSDGFELLATLPLK
jgi:signal transduction histidine kinase